MNKVSFLGRHKETIRCLSIFLFCWLLKIIANNLFNEETVREIENFFFYIFLIGISAGISGCITANEIHEYHSKYHANSTDADELEEKYQGIYKGIQNLKRKINVLSKKHQEIMPQIHHLFLSDSNKEFIKAWKERDYLKATNLIYSKKASVHAFDRWGYKAIHFASMNLDFEEIKWLLAMGEDVNCETYNKYPFTGFKLNSLCLVLKIGDMFKYLTVSDDKRAKIIEIAKFLISKKANIYHPAIIYHFRNDLLFDEVEEFLSPYIRPYLVKKEENQKRRWNEKLLEACELFNYSRISRLVIKGADVKYKNKAGKTPLKIAMERGDQKIIELLKRNGAEE